MLAFVFALTLLGLLFSRRIIYILMSTNVKSKHGLRCNRLQSSIKTNFICLQHSIWLNTAYISDNAIIWEQCCWSPIVFIDSLADNSISVCWNYCKLLMFVLHFYICQFFQYIFKQFFRKIIVQLFCLLKRIPWTM